MARAQRTIVISRPIEDVFAFIADAENDPQWRPGVREIKRQGELGKGATYTQRVAGPAGRSVPADIEVTDYDPPTRLAFKGIAGPVRPHGEYRLQSVASGSELTFSLDAELTGFKKAFIQGSVQKSMEAEMANLDTLKGILES